MEKIVLLSILSLLFSIPFREEVTARCMSYMTNRWSNIRFLTFAENEALLNFITDTVVRHQNIEEKIS